MECFILVNRRKAVGLGIGGMFYLSEQKKNIGFKDRLRFYPSSH